MDAERVDKIIKRVAGDDPYLKILLRGIYCVGRSEIDNDSCVPRVARKLVRAAGMMTHRRMVLRELLNDDYWQTRDGEITRERISDFVQSRLKLK